MNIKIAIIGAGASGMIAASIAAREGATVTVFEKNDRVGKKILMTGNGKCNLSNLFFSNDCYKSSSECKNELLDSVFQEFSVADTMSYFQSIGLLMKEKEQYLYPFSEQASTVLDVLRFELEHNGIEILTESNVITITAPSQNTNENQFKVMTNEKTYLFDKVILACGSKACPKSGSDGSGYEFAKKMNLSLVPPVPALVQLKCKEDFFKAIHGVRSEGIVTFYCHNREPLIEAGEIQFTDYGISGIPVFQASGIVARTLLKQKHVKATIDFIPSFQKEELQRFLNHRLSYFTNNTMEQYVTGLCNKKIMMLLLKLCQLKPNDIICELNQSTRNQFLIQQMAMYLKEFPVTIYDTNSFQNAQVCAGGIELSQVTAHLEVKKIPNLYVVGELLDVDGRCGGYNLQWAWSSGFVAGKHAAIKK